MFVRVKIPTQAKGRLEWATRSVSQGAKSLPEMRLRPARGSNKADKGYPLWKAWIRGDVLVVFGLRP